MNTNKETKTHSLVNSFSLRPYQQIIIDQSIDHFRKSPEPIIIDACVGAGKTLIISHIARHVIQKGGRVISLAHTKELVESAYETFTRYAPDLLVFTMDTGLFYLKFVAASTNPLLLSSRNTRITVNPTSYPRILMAKSLNELSDDNSESSEQPLNHEKSVAGLAIRPTMLAANTIRNFNQVVGTIDLIELIRELATQIKCVKKGDMGFAEETLAAQAKVLDTLFNALAVKSLQAPGLDMQATVLKLALQSQRQCCLTIEALAAIKKPPAVTVVRQTNISQAVQVNNGATDEIPQTNLENELLEITNGERLDSGAQIAPITVNQDLAAMEKINRPQERSR